MSRLEKLDRTNWREVTEAPLGVLMLSKSDCATCQAWTEELEAFLADDQEFTDVRFGKLLLDQPGLVEFKRENPWVSEVDALPFNILYAGGAQKKTFAGKGVDRLVNRLRNLRA